MKNYNFDKIWYISMKIGAKLGCHQRPDRSFFMHGYQFPVCARCTGVFIGQILSIIFFPDICLSMKTYIFLCIPMLFDWSTQYLGKRESTQPIRFLTGIAGGYALFSMELMLAKKIILLLGERV